MKLTDKVAVVTGGARGIGRALCRRFAAEGARGVAVADVDGAGAEEVAREIGGLAVRTDVSREADIVQLVERATAAFGAIDLFCSNAGIATGGGVETSDATGSASGASISWRTCMRRARCCRACWRAAKGICCRPLRRLDC
jgi:NAD(P)-dependent dehydrogenase (short-subunit alcohol dehydrogenase family)